MKYYYYLFLVLLMTACSPKVLVQQTSTAFSNVPIYAPFAVFKLNTSFEPTNAQLIGSIEVKDGGFALNCDLKTVTDIAVAKARTMGGNCLKITTHKPPNHISTCHRIRAEVYHITDATPYEEEIVWHKERKLAIRDFKGSIEQRPFQAATVSAFQYFTERNPLNGKANIKAQSLFYCPLSYFKPSDSDSLILAHEQLHFDITELYARKFIEKIVKEVPTYQSLLDKHEQIAKDIVKAWQQKQDEYDSEVYADYSKQAKWDKWVKEQLQAYAAFKDKIAVFDT